MIESGSPDPWMEHMRRGDFESAWRVSDALRSTASPCDLHLVPRHQQSIWNGRSLEEQRVLVRCYHGLGDTLQFARFLPLVKASAKEVTVWVQPSLGPLLASMQCVDRLLPLHDGMPECEYDVDVEIMELAYVFRSTHATLPVGSAYIRVEPRDRSSSDQLTVGVVWKAGEWDTRRSIRFATLAPLLETPGIDWRILQQNATGAGWTPGLGTLFCGDTLYEDARAIASLDLLISIDSMPAHLAGALGIPVWTLLPTNADWRWGNDDRTCWYPTMRLFRQDTSGDWDGVMKRVRRELEMKVSRE